jgi:hypothetical protein
VKGTVAICIIVFLLGFSSCETSHSPVPQTDVSGIWRGKLDSMVMEIRVSMVGSALSGEVVWQVGDPPENVVSLSGRIVGNTTADPYHRLHKSAPLSERC